MINGNINLEQEYNKLFRKAMIELQLAEEDEQSEEDKEETKNDKQRKSEVNQVKTYRLWDKPYLKELEEEEDVFAKIFSQP